MLLAKPEESLRSHTEKALAVFSNYSRENSKILANLAERLNTTSDTLYEAAYLGIFAHDWGKATAQFQSAVHKREKPKLFHAPLSAWLLANSSFPLSGDWLAVIWLAVLSHHGQMHHGTMSSDRTRARGKIEIWIQKLIAELKVMETRMSSIELLDTSVSGAELVRFVEHARRQLNNLPPDRKLLIKARYTWLHAILRWCDNLASKGETGEAEFGSESAFKAFLAGNHPCTIQPNDIQQQLVMAKKTFAVLQAGCGSGKTGAALAWAAKLWQEGKINRVIFTLPTQFTSNSLYWDLYNQYGFPRESVGIYHSEVETVLRREADAEDEYNWGEIKYFNSFYQKIMTVSTVDHLLYSLLHGHRYADRAFGNLLTSLVVFDEEHYYDDYTLPKIAQAMELLRKLRVPHLVMSATMPQVFAEYFAGLGYTVLQEKKREESPALLEKVNHPLLQGSDLSQDFFERVAAFADCKQMVVVNQVERAKKIAMLLAKKLPDVQVICYHSEFTRRDRHESEKEIRKLFRDHERGNLILVSTQVCELSLDISADVLHTELAPVDALIQRLGRSHRRGTHHIRSQCTCNNCRQRLYLPEEFSYLTYIYQLDWSQHGVHLPYKPDLLKNTWEIVAEGPFKMDMANQWVNRIYSELPLLKDFAMYQYILEDTVFGRTPKERYGDEEGEVSQGRFRVRQSGQQTVTVIPSSLWKSRNDFSLMEDFIKEHGVSVSLNKIKYHHAPRIWKNGVCILDVPYNADIGFQF